MSLYLPAVVAIFCVRNWPKIYNCAVGLIIFHVRIPAEAAASMSVGMMYDNM